jgi:hypothetical protein
MKMEEAQALPHVACRPLHLHRHPGPGAPLRRIVAEGRLGPIGRWVLLECQHWREIVHYDLLPLEARRSLFAPAVGFAVTALNPKRAILCGRQHRSAATEFRSSTLPWP